MTQQWFVQRHGERQGPYSPRELAELAQRGEIQPDDLVWQAGMPDWIPASRVAGLLGAQGESTNEGPSGPMISPQNTFRDDNLVSDEAPPEEPDAPSQEEPIPGFAPQAYSSGVTPGGMRRRQTFEGSPTTFARSREGRGPHLLDAWLVLLRRHFGTNFLDATIQLFAVCGRYGLLLGACLLALSTGFQTPRSWQPTGVIALVILLGVLIIGHYVSQRLLILMARWEQRTRAQLASSVLPDAVSLLSFLVSLLALVLGTLQALATGLVDLIFLGLAIFIWGVFAAIQILDLEGLKVAINPELSPVDELLGLVQLFLKMIVRLCAVVFGVLTLLGDLHLLLGLIVVASSGTASEHALETWVVSHSASEGYRELAASGWGLGQSGLIMLLAAAVWPLVTYAVYLFGQFLVTVTLSLLALLSVLERGSGPAGDLSKRDLTDA